MPLSGIKLYKCENPKLFKLHIWNPDQPGFLFRLCELLLRYKIEIADADVEPKDNLMHANLTLRAFDTDFSHRVERFCKEVETFMVNCEMQDPPSPEDPITLERLYINLDLDLLNVTSFDDLNSDDPEMLASADQGLCPELRYRLKVICINQTGVLAFLALVLFKSGFNIVNIKCGTPAAASAWLIFELTTASRKANQVIRTYLDIPYGAVKISRSRACSGDSDQQPKPPIFADSVLDEYWPPGCCQNLRNGLDARIESHEAIPVGNGDIYEGAVSKSPGGRMKQHGFGTYTYNSNGHSDYKEYKGQWNDGKKHGHGVLRYKNGSVYVGQWQEGKRHGFGALFEYDDPNADKHSMPRQSYEGEWRADTRHGLGAEESPTSYYYGNYAHGSREGRGVRVRLDEYSRPIGCEVLADGREYSMLESLEREIEYLQKATRAKAIPSVKSMPDVNPGIHGCENPNSSKDHAVSADIELHLPEANHQSKMAAVTESFGGSSFSSFGRRHILSPFSRNQSVHAEPQPSPNHNCSWLQSPKASPKAVVSMQYASPKSLAWMASPSLKKSADSVGTKSHGKSAPASPSSPMGATGSAPVSPAESEEDIEFTLEISDAGPPPPYRSPDTLQAMHETSVLDSTTSTKESLTSLHPPSPKGLPSPSASRQTSASCQKKPNSDPKADNMRKAWMPEKRTSTKRPIMGPMLWSEDELAAFLSCLGLNSEIARNIQQCSLKGVDHLTQMSNTQLKERFGIASIADCIVMRKALKRFLVLDRMQNNVSRLSPTHSRDDPNLTDCIISPQDLALGEKISEGGYGCVYKAVLTSHSSAGKSEKRFVAVKEMTGTGSHPLSSLIKEGRIMAKIKHKNICKFIGISADRESKRRMASSKQYIVSELLDCSLYELIHCGVGELTSELTQPLVLRVSAGICAGMMYLHDNELVHADLKPQNILIDQHSSKGPFPKICDFGHVAMRVNPSPHRLICTPHWAAPEALREDDLSSASDVYSLGVILWEMLSGEIPFHGYSYAQLVGAVGWAGNLPEMKLLPQISEELRLLMLSCLEFMPGDRPSARDIRKELRQIRKEQESAVLDLMKCFMFS